MVHRDPVRILSPCHIFFTAQLETVAHRSISPPYFMPVDPITPSMHQLKPGKIPWKVDVCVHAGGDMGSPSPTLPK